MPVSGRAGDNYLMRAMGIDCGTQFTGYGVVEQGGDGRLRCVALGAIRLRRNDDTAHKLAAIFEGLTAIIETHQPDMVAIEEIFYSVNVKSALKLGQVRGVALLAASSCKREVAEYSPLSIKSAVVGYGRAEKSQVQQMVTHLLALDAVPEPPDITDALAIAICHLNTYATLIRQQAAPAGR